MPLAQNSQSLVSTFHDSCWSAVHISRVPDHALPCDWPFLFRSTFVVVHSLHMHNVCEVATVGGRRSSALVNQLCEQRHRRVAVGVWQDRQMAQPAAGPAPMGSNSVSTLMWQSDDCCVVYQSPGQFMLPLTHRPVLCRTSTVCYFLFVSFLW